MRKALFALMLAVCVGVSACPAVGEDTPLRVTASFFPLYIAAINICQDVPGVEIACMAPPAAGCLHDYQMTTADRRLLEESDVLLLNGAGLESFMDKLLPQLSARIIEASAGAALQKDAHGEDNPHVWVSVEGMIAEVNAIADGLAQADPTHATQYASNAAAYVQRLTAMKEELAETLAPLSGMPIITFHEAFDYFAPEFGLRVVATVHHHEDAAPSAREIAGLVAIIEQDDVRALFAEPYYQDASVDIISREAGVPVYTLNPVTDGEAEPSNLDAYQHIMRENATTLLEALS
ncbi:metal ABC transporter substrate-binding protein [Eubacteriales bacterium OttesenSCG-928-A19]|nr:metal ABC transporter substrate-binding protein [Eubacteriales bacterium OttesenSCG-928-A19]